ncbi:hypothetical protein [Kocuria sp. NPDC057446]|uniref:hypothetical protein n=1 Tax=Kocuria sp. NPDC057446 TaxID=3346137 RepID=UPI0036C50FF3
MIVVLWVAMFLCTFHTVVLARRSLLMAALVLNLVTVLWAAAAPGSLGLDAPTDAWIPTFLVFLAGGLLGKLVDYIRREQLGPPKKPGTRTSPAPAELGTLKYLD